MRTLLVRRSSNIGHDLPLLVACAADIKAFCPLVPGDKVQQCLREVKAKLSLKCSEAVTSRLIDSAEDISLDPELNRACFAVRLQSLSHCVVKQCAANSMLSHQPL